jgi:hypothetical protein
MVSFIFFSLGGWGNTKEDEKTFAGGATGRPSRESALLLFLVSAKEVIASGKILKKREKSMVGGIVAVRCESGEGGVSTVRGKELTAKEKGFGRKTKSLFFPGAEGRNRTGTPVRATVFETVVSTNSTTSAKWGEL